MKKSVLLAAALALAATAWLISGQLGEKQEAEAQKPPAVLEDEASIPSVRVRTQVAEARTNRIVLRGRTEAVRTVEIRAETQGLIRELAIERGATVKAGDLLARLSAEGRPAQLKEAQALYKQRKVEVEAARRLSKKGFRAETQLAAAEAAMEAAEASVRYAQVEIENTRILAPFDGLIDERMIELGDFVDRGDRITRIVDLDPILVVANVNELDIGRLSVGEIGEARLITGLEVAGQIRFISSVADSQTRTFRVELEVPNPDGAIPDGVSAELRLPVEEVAAHRVSPAILTLTDQGEVGVRTLDKENRVRFQKVKILDNDRDGVWLSGLPAQVTFITVGQEFVVEGQEVSPVKDSDGIAASEPDAGS